MHVSSSKFASSDAQFLVGSHMPLPKHGRICFLLRLGLCCRLFLDFPEFACKPSCQLGNSKVWSSWCLNLPLRNICRGYVHRNPKTRGSLRTRPLSGEQARDRAPTSHSKSSGGMCTWLQRQQVSPTSKLTAHYITGSLRSPELWGTHRVT